MIISKEYVGKYESAHHLVHYYLVHKDLVYGVEMVEEKEDKVVSTLEWFSEDQEDTKEFIQLLCNYGAMPIHLSEFIDDFQS